MFEALKSAASAAANSVSKKTIAGGNDNISLNKISRDVKTQKQRTTYSYLHGVKDLFQYPALGYAESSEYEIHALRKKYGDKYWISMPNMMFFPLIADEEHTFEAQIPQYPVSQNYNIADNVNILPKVFHGTLILTATPMAKPNYRLEQTPETLFDGLIDADPEKIDGKRARRQTERESKKLVKAINDSSGKTRGQRQAANRANTETILYHHKIFDNPYQQYEQLKIFFKNKIPVFFISSFENYTDMLIERMYINRNFSNAGRIEVDITLREVRFAKNPEMYSLQSPQVSIAKGTTKKTQLVPAIPCKDGASLPNIKNIGPPSMADITGMIDISSISGMAGTMDISGISGMIDTESIKTSVLEKAGQVKEFLNNDNIKDAMDIKLDPSDIINLKDLAGQNLSAVSKIIDEWNQNLAAVKKQGLPAQLTDLWSNRQMCEIYGKMGTVIGENDLLDGGFNIL
ncbi:MAG: hypothetical protein LBH98_03155 [Chitinispirillales bacterium]|jgi:hypothetical protein|nr:hypothetical protein [Chitinispirillales bacterium]